jgi:hypothetical protein
MKIVLPKQTRSYSLALFFFTSLVVAQFNRTQTFTSNGTFTVPAGVTTVQVEAWGAGGAGGGVSGTTTNARAAGGGSGGTFTRNTAVTVIPLSIISVTVGTGGVGVLGGNGGNGTNSIFSSAIPVTAIGGGGGRLANDITLNGIGGGISTGITWNGGAGANAISGTSGGGGGGAGRNASGASPTGQIGGAGGSGNGGNGANGFNNTSTNGNNGLTYGGGGSGARRAVGVTVGSFLGGSGGNGLIIVSWNEREINVTGNSVSIVNNDTTPSTTDHTDFGTTAVTSGIIVRTFTIQNTGTTNLTISNPTLSGTNMADFTISANPSTLTILPNTSTSFQVTFDPSNAGLRTASLSILNNDFDENPYVFSIRGAGTAPEAEIVGNSLVINDGDSSPATSDFTDFAGSLTRTFFIRNQGNANLTLGAITIGGTNQSDFAVTTFPNSTVLPGGSASVVITFIPGAVGLRTATFSIVTNDSDENPYNFSIQATGIPPTMNVRGNNIIINDNDATPTITDWTDFNSTNLNTSISRIYSIQNTGNFTLNLTGSPRLTLSGSSDFSIILQPTTPIATSGTTSFVIQFTPSSLGTKTATVSIANNDPGSGKNPYNFTIQGTGIQAFIDRDGDGVFDNIDRDDDNDGIPDSLEQSIVTSSIPNFLDVSLLNETFGAGTTRTQINTSIPSVSTTFTYENGVNGGAIIAPDIDNNVDLNDGQYTVFHQSGTTNVASWAPTHWYQGLDHTPGDTNGRMALFNATNSISEEFYRTTVLGVITNVPLTYSFWVLNLDRANAPGIASRLRPNLTVEFRDLSNNLISVINTNDIAPSAATPSLSDWKQFSTTFIPTSTGYSIIFKNNQLGGLVGNDLAIDDILIQQRLADSDRDTLANVFDLDSDNDGISDTVEDGWANISNGFDRMDRTTAGVWVDVNGNGWHDTIEAFYASNTPKNFDGDAVPNYLDLDSDNDSRFDVDEATNFSSTYLNGDGDVNGDGTGDATDSDGDGILNPFDTFIGFGSVAKINPMNSIGSGNYDALKIASQTGIFDISTTLYASLDANNNGVIDGTTDVDRDGILDAFDTNTSYYGSPRNLNQKLLLDFDGRNDYAQGAAVFGGLSNATLMAWIDLSSTFSTSGVIVGQDNFKIKVNSSLQLEVTVNNSTYTNTSVVLDKRRWYHVGATYGNGRVKLYLNGKIALDFPQTGSINVDASLLTMGKNPSSNTEFFRGKMDEIRVFNVTLTDDQFQRIVYQEIQNNNGQVRGTIIPKDVGSLPFANLVRYYKMDTYQDDIIDDVTTLPIDVVSGMKMYNHKNIYTQQAPMPFVTKTTGTFATAVNDTANDIRGMDVIEQDCSIVQVNHNITETANNVELGMFINSGVTLVMENDTKIQNDWYLKLDGKIDLEDKSQLIQTVNSDLDITSTGFIERDQQGQSNIYNYNYWSSPVSPMSTTSNNNNYTVGGVMKDGTFTIPANLNWTTGYNGSPTSPITLSNYWIYKFQNATNTYANWSSIGSIGQLQPGQGYTLKGSGVPSESQNYTFVGKPNNGVITSTVAANNLNLCGNPYPSALDVSKFIDDNLTSTTGTLYFWEHFSTNTSHNLIQYQGGYATRTKVGGTPPVAPAGISTSGSSIRVAKQFIPVGQGFFVTGNSSGGIITFNNSQRLFVKEDSPSAMPMYRNTNQSTQAITNPEDEYLITPFQKIRLNYHSPNDINKQLLIGFMNEFATDGIDLGYDGLSIDDNPTDIYFKISNEKYTIQGVGFFDSSSSYPIGLLTESAGISRISLEELEVFDTNQNIYIYDNVLNTYTNLQEQPFEVELPAGAYEDRFFLRFVNPNPLGVTENEIDNLLGILYSSSTENIVINNLTNSIEVNNVELFNLNGQKIYSWNIENPTQSALILPVHNVSTSVYVVKVTTNKGLLSKKIIIE